ncbi:MAG: hypothetical protein LBI42_07530 [Chitinispirillales bacterium]|jgi:uncharacterized membrane protein|nr:hypothetical protein [Chitinispirillales bacterium]
MGKLVTYLLIILIITITYSALVFSISDYQQSFVVGLTILALSLCLIFICKKFTLNYFVIPLANALCLLPALFRSLSENSDPIKQFELAVASLMLGIFVVIPVFAISLITCVIIYLTSPKRRKRKKTRKRSSKKRQYSRSKNI